MIKIKEEEEEDDEEMQHNLKLQFCLICRLSLFCFLSADPEGPGVCATILTLVSFVLVLVTMPLSLCVTVKVGRPKAGLPPEAEAGIEMVPTVNN